MHRIMFGLIVLVALFQDLVAQGKAAEPAGKISGLAYTDYFYNITRADTSENDLNGLVFRRIYFTYDHRIDAKFDARFRLEADQEANTSNGKIGVFVKDAYLKWKNIFSGSNLVVGASPTPAFNVSEGTWGYRSLEKTIMDLEGIVSSRDIGVDLMGKFDNEGTANYWVKLGNNSGNRPEVDKYKRLYGLLHFKITSQVQATAYADYDMRPKRLDSFDGVSKKNDRLVLAGFLGVSNKSAYSVGVEGVFRTIANNFREAAGQALTSQEALGISLFGWVAVAERVRFIGRYDFFDPNTMRSNDATSYILSAVDFIVGEDVHLMPNILLRIYQAPVASDVIARVTFEYNFKQ